MVYGASGYTGRLVCEYLREFNVPFITAGRDKARIAEALETVPGIGTVEHEIVEVEHAVGPLTELIDGASVVCNMVGPFATYGAEVVEACLATGCHYLDTTGEQDWLIAAEAAYGARMAGAGLLLAPRVARGNHRGDRRPALPGRAGPRHPRHPRLLEGRADRRLHPDDPGQRRPRQGLLP